MKTINSFIFIIVLTFLIIGCQPKVYINSTSQLQVNVMPSSNIFVFSTDTIKTTSDKNLDIIIRQELDYKGFIVANEMKSSDYMLGYMINSYTGSSNTVVAYPTNEKTKATLKNPLDPSNSLILESETTKTKPKTIKQYYPLQEITFFLFKKGNKIPVWSSNIMIDSKNYYLYPRGAIREVFELIGINYSGERTINHFIDK